MHVNLKFFLGIFLCLLYVQNATINANARPKDSGFIKPDPREISPDMPPVQMGTEKEPQVPHNGSDWKNKSLLEIRNTFEAELLPHLLKVAKLGIVPKKMMENFINAHFVETKRVSAEDAHTVIKMMKKRIDWLLAKISQDLRRIESTSKKYEEVSRYHFEKHSQWPIIGGDSKEWGPPSEYEKQRAKLGLLGVSEE